MFYAERDKQGNIIAIHKSRKGDEEHLTPVAAHELREFLASEQTSEHEPGSYQALLEEADRKMIRVLDDLIEVLIIKNIIMLTDLPAEAREKLGTRKNVRNRLQELGTDLTVEDIL